jgi:hypothetical protein
MNARTTNNPSSERNAQSDEVFSKKLVGKPCGQRQVTILTKSLRALSVVFHRAADRRLAGNQKNTLDIHEGKGSGLRHMRSLNAWELAHNYR